jgi:hypothetical protein
MKCKKMERLLLRSFDDPLKNKKKETLKNHLESCPLCQRRKKEYKIIADNLREKDIPEPKPYFWERLQPKLKEPKKFEPWLEWKWGSIRAVPLSLAIIIFIALATLLFIPKQKKELSQSELLLQNVNPIQETKTLFEEEKIEDKNMKLIWLAMEDKNSTRRPWP